MGEERHEQDWLVLLIVNDFMTGLSVELVLVVLLEASRRWLSGSLGATWA